MWAIKVNDSPDLLSKFRLAQQISRCITDKIIGTEWFLETLKIEGKELRQLVKLK